MPAPRRLKKSETLEIRLPHPTKQAFMARCRADGVSASEALRAFIDQRLEAPRAARRRMRLIAGAMVASALGAAAAPTLAHPNPQGEFARLDANHDGVVTFAEYSAARR